MASPNPGLNTLAPADPRHLWQIDHPYYCNDTNYFGKYENGFECTDWASWNDFYAEFDLEDTDMDYNLVFRWDWKFDPDDDEHKLHLYFMAQRKGYFFVNIIDVTPADEPAVREYLTAYAEHMRKIWEPLL